MSDKYYSGIKTKFFQGWYFKQACGRHNIAFIPGYAVSGDKLFSAFIQVITDKGSYYAEYPADSFSAARDNLKIKIGKSEFSEEGVKLDLTAGGVAMKGELEFSGFNPPEKKLLCPNIMGPFDFLPGLECKHYIYSMHHEVNGVLRIGQNDIVFNGGRGYCEGDRGRSFPKGYFWAQSNCFGGADACVMLAAADVPYMGAEFCGVTSIFKYAGKEYRFATYNGTKIALFEDRGDIVNISLRRGGSALDASVALPLGYDLKAPKEGRMGQTVKEAVTASLSLKIMVGQNVIFRESNIICSAESFGKVRCMSYEPAKAAGAAKTQ